MGGGPDPWRRAKEIVTDMELQSQGYRNIPQYIISSAVEACERANYRSTELTAEIAKSIFQDSQSRRCGG